MFKQAALALAVLSTFGCAEKPAKAPLMHTLHDFTVLDIEDKPTALSQYKGKVVLIVNVASKCGLTPQYAELQKLYETHRDSGFVILGFPSNDFLWQEPGTNAQIREFCSLKYKVTFPMFSKIKVKGSDADSLYQWLTSQDTKPEGPGKISWNFEKFLIGKDGNVLSRFSPRTEPSDPRIEAAITSALQAP